ncbi:MAG: ABC transporter ATP-binding protein [Clostridia bacterium]|nr:ABC transporter ATP-binding protein [Clostridia bacterium]
MNVIEIRNLTKYYGKSVGVDDISIDIKQGEFFGFIGPNGAGKSTTINCMLNYLFPTSGSIKILGLDSVKNSAEIKKNIGFVPSEVFYYDNMKVDELLKYSLSFYKHIDKSMIYKYTDLLELDKDKKIGELSMGNKKKVAIVQAVIHNPKLLILDEPTNGLDPLMQQKLFKLLDDLRKQGTTIFMSSHMLEDVQKYCTNVAIIKQGKIIKQGNISSLLPHSFKIINIKSVDVNKLKTNLDFKFISNFKEIDSKNIKFMYSGNLTTLFKNLALIDIRDITIESPTLEDLFMQYY